jgi:hypothetical protein
MGMEAFHREITASYQGEDCIQTIPTLVRPELPMPMARPGILGIFCCSWKILEESHKKIKIASWRP